MKRASLEQELAHVEQRIASGQRRVAGQRQVIVVLERSGRPTDYAKYLLSGLELLQVSHRDARKRLIGGLGKTDTHALDESNERRSAFNPGQTSNPPTTMSTNTLSVERPEQV
jgi:hypothetical protein